MSLLSALTGCARASDTNFSQRAGFADYFTANPPSKSLPGSADRELLKRYRPHLYITAGTPPPLRFYDDYIAQGRLIGEDGTVLSGAVTPALLNLHKEEPRTVFEHLPAAGRTAPVMYGRVDRESFDLGGTKRHFPFLTWSAVFRTSGIAASISWWKGAVLGAVGNLTDWHQLDHYTAVTLALDEMQKPVAVMYQQHNYRQTQIF